MLYTNMTDDILEKLGVNTDELPDNLYSTKLKALAEAPLGGGSGGVTHWDDLEGKPFGEKKVVETVLFEGENLAFFLQPNNIVGLDDEPVSPFGYFEIGEKYDVIWNGVRYADLVANANTEEEGTWIGTPYNELSTEHPLVMYTYADGSYVYLSMSLYSTEIQHDIKIVKVEETTTPIPKELLPEPLRFGEEAKVLVDEQEVTVDETEYGCFTSDPFQIELIEGQEYVVSFNGVDYTNKAVNLEGTVFVGNQSFMNGQNDSGEPFIVAVVGNKTVLAVAEAGTYTIKISGMEVTPIDEKYLPESVVPLIGEILRNEGTLTGVSISEEDIVTAVNSGRDVRLVETRADTGEVEGVYRIGNIGSGRIEFSQIVANANYIYIMWMNYDRENKTWSEDVYVVMDNTGGPV